LLIGSLTSGESRIRYIGEARALFAAKSPHINREKRICRAFLRCIGAGYTEDELICGPCEPIDVTFGEARFQVTEVLGEKRRGDALRNLEQKYKTASVSHELLVPIGEPECISVPESAAEVRRRLEQKFLRYGESKCKSLDALVHIELANHYLYPIEVTCTEDVRTIKAEGWRSVSVLIIPYAIVLFANQTAPAFLKDQVRRVHCVDADKINRLYDE
jgi:Putative endonuclease, protein of unknown function (DUF1780)